MQVTSNISAVLERTRRLTTHVIPGALRRSLTPGYWQGHLRQEAEATLNLLAAGDGVKDGDVVTGFLNTLMLTGLPDGFAALMTYPRRGGLTYQTNLLDKTLEPLTAKSSADFSQLLGDLHDWVQNEKRWNVLRDGEKTPERVLQKADWFAYEMLAPTSSIITDPASPHAGQRVRDVVLPRLAEYLAGKTSSPDLTPERITAWLAAVLAAWRRLVLDVWPQKFRQELKAGLA